MGLYISNNSAMLCNKNGLTLIEVIVVFTLIVFLAVIVYHAMIQRKFRANMTTVKMDMIKFWIEIGEKYETIGRWVNRDPLQDLVFGMELPYATTSSNIPKENIWNNSTDFFAYYGARCEKLGAKPEMLSGPGLSVARDWKEFACNDKYNAWCVVSTVNKRRYYPENTPIFFTRNLGQNTNFT